MIKYGIIEATRYDSSMRCTKEILKRNWLKYGYK